MADMSVMETIKRLVWEYGWDNRGKRPNCIFISTKILALVDTKYDFHISDKDKVTLFGLKVYEVVQDGVIKVTD